MVSTRTDRGLGTLKEPGNVKNPGELLATFFKDFATEAGVSIILLAVSISSV